jgi:hypothetical protein
MATPMFVTVVGVWVVVMPDGRLTPAELIGAP